MTPEGLQEFCQIPPILPGFSWSSGLWTVTSKKQWIPVLRKVKGNAAAWVLWDPLPCTGPPNPGCHPTREAPAKPLPYSPTPWFHTACLWDYGFFQATTLKAGSCRPSPHIPGSTHLGILSPKMLILAS